MQPSHPLVLESLRRNRRQLILAAIITLPFGAFCMLAPWWSSEGRGVTYAAVGIGLLSLAVGAFAASTVARSWNLERSPIAEMLRTRAHDIVWIYVQQMDSQAVGITVAKAYTVRVQLADGKGHNLSVAGRKRDDLLTVLADLAPRATFGYSRELAKQYKHNPSSLAVTV